MPAPCKKPRYAYNKKKNVRLTFCGGKVVEAKSAKVVQLERQFKKKINKGKRGGYFFNKYGKRVYVQ